VSTWEAGPAEERLVMTWRVDLPPGQIGRIEVRKGATPLLVYEAR
jgi:hypothetical protein